jgi:hypothetical protein
MGGRGLPLLLLLISALFAQIRASDPVIDLPDIASLPAVVFQALSRVRFLRFNVCGFWLAVQLFHETFDETFEGSWVVSGKEEYTGNSSRLDFVLCLFRWICQRSAVGGLRLAGVWVSDLAMRPCTSL